MFAVGVAAGVTDAVALHADALVIDVHTHGIGFLPRPVARAYRAATRGSMPPDVPLSELGGVRRRRRRRQGGR